jgi:hypothetical protein
MKKLTIQIGERTTWDGHARELAGEPLTETFWLAGTQYLFTTRGVFVVEHDPKTLIVPPTHDVQ